MRKIFLTLVLLFVMGGGFFAVGPGLGHPAVPNASLGRINPNAATGMHRAVENLCEDGVAYHVFQARFNPHNGNGCGQ